jgi:hypothetical protein
VAHEGYVVEYYPCWEEFPGKGFLETLQVQSPQVYNRLMILIKALRAEGFAIRGNFVKTYAADIKEFKISDHRIFFVKGQADRYWVIWACKKKSRALPPRDDRQVRHRAAHARTA